MAADIVLDQFLSKRDVVTHSDHFGILRLHGQGEGCALAVKRSQSLDIGAEIGVGVAQWGRDEAFQAIADIKVTVETTVIIHFQLKQVLRFVEVFDLLEDHGSFGGKVDDFITGSEVSIAVTGDPEGVGYTGDLATDEI